MLAAFVSHPDCTRHEMGPGHPECPERLAAIQDRLLAASLLDYMLPCGAPLATEEQLERAHSALCVRQVVKSAPADDDSRKLRGAPNMVNVGLPRRRGSEAFRVAVNEHWLPALEAFKPELIVVSAGFDAHREDDMGNLALVDADYEWVTRQLMRVAKRHARGRVVSCLEGGYVLNPLARSVAAHVKVLIGAD